MTAREMYNLARAAEAGWAGPVAEARDFDLDLGLPAGPVGGVADRGDRGDVSR